MGVLGLLGLEAFSICSTYSLFLSGSIFSFRYLPKGDCRLCCPIETDKDITFNLFTRKNHIIPQQLFLDEPWSVAASDFDPNHPTIVYIHGFTERAMGASARTVKEAYLQKADYNVIVVDWGPLSGFPYYAASAKNTRLVGPYVAEFVRFLHNLGAIDVHRLHVIGFSLGAEVAGFAGKALGQGVLARITGLDPAYPLYIFQGDHGHLAKGDARFVDIIHTDGGVFGFPNPIGDADFYPNGGVALQPGCRLSQLTHRGHPDEVIACSHNRAWMYYAESVLKEDVFPAMACDDQISFQNKNCTNVEGRADYATMGFAADPNRKGKFFLKTAAEPPYGRKEEDEPLQIVK